MNLYECYSYKTFYFIMKDISNLDVKNYKLVQDMYDPEEYKQPDYSFDYDFNMVCTKGIDLLKTKYGYFVYHYYENIEEVKEFLKQNSKRKPCAVFGSHRTADVYLAGIAENGEIKRLLYFEDGETIIEGEPTKFEIENNLHVDIDDFESQIEFFNEDTIFEYAKWFAGFDIENEDVEIQDMVYYSRIPFKSELSENIGQELKSSMKKQNINLMNIFIAYNKIKNKVVVAGVNLESGDDAIVSYCDVVYDIANKQEFVLSLSRCVNALAELDLKQSQSLMYYFNNFQECLFNKDCKIMMGVISSQKDYMLNLAPYQEKGRQIKWNVIKQIFKGKVYTRLDSSSVEDIYNRCLKFFK